MPRSSSRTTRAFAAARLNRVTVAFPFNRRVLKKVVVLLVAGFAVYYLLTAPQGAAEAIRNAFNAVLDAFGQIMVFFNELLSS